MQCKIGVVSIGKLAASLMEEVHVMGLDSCFVFSDTLMYEGMPFPQELYDTDLLISSGYNTTILRKITTKPIINMEPSLFDILVSYSAAINIDANPVIILPVRESADLMQRIRNILSVSIVADVYRDIAELDTIIRSYRDRGCRCIIGSGLACTEAERLGMHSVFVYPRESLRSYLALAYDSASAIHEKTRENKFLSLALDNARDGIMFTDEKGTILVANSSARVLFSDGPLKNLVGLNILELTDNAAIHRLYMDYEPIKNIITEFNKEKYIFAANPIRFYNEVANIMLSFYSIQSIQSKERHIRSALNRKRFVAPRSFSDYNTGNEMFRRILRIARNYAGHDENILLTGSNGCGKDMMAEAIHNGSRRAESPFVRINCSAMEDELMEEEIFGCEEGVFPGGKKNGKTGLFEIAHGGTVYLDEVVNLSTVMQARLLRVLQEKQIVRVGGTRLIPCDVRIIASTEKDLWKLVHEQMFNDSLYYRLAVLELNLPPLCQRPEDIYPTLIEFLKEINPPLAIQFSEQREELEKLLQTYSWPGNIRELENLTRMISAMLGPHDTLNEGLDLMEQEIRRRRNRLTTAVPKPVPEQSTAAALDPEVLLSEQSRIRAALASAEGNYTKAAALLGISRTTLWRKIKSLNI